jgi:hypothetical protein
MNRSSVQRCVFGFILSVLTGVTLMCLLRTYPCAAFAMLAPASDSVWELSKAGYWPCLISLAVLSLIYHKEWNEAACFAMLICVPAALLLAFSLTDMLLGIHSPALHGIVWLAVLAAAFALMRRGESRAASGRMLRVLCLASTLLGVLYLVFTFAAPPAALFLSSAAAETMATIGW